MNLRSSLHRSLVIVVATALLLPQSVAPAQSSAFVAGTLVFTKHTIATDIHAPNLFHATDLDTDGDADILVGHGGANYFTWLENNGDQGFTPHKVYASFVMNLTSFFTTDLDGDQDIDILTTAYHQDWAGWWENDGQQNFTMRTLRSAGGPFGVAAADLDEDHDMDIVLALSGANSVQWGENDGHQVFTWRVVASGAIGVRFVSTADMDGDGDQDLLSAGGRVQWHENNSHGLFTNHAIASVGMSYAARAVDMDGDGDQDVLDTAFGYQWIRWWENDGQQSFIYRNVGSSVSSYSAYAADMDGDGDVDVFSQSTLLPEWYENDGNAVFARHSVTGGVACQSAIPADVDGDGDTDVVGADYYGGEVSWWESNAGDSWPDFALESLTVTPLQPEVMDSAGIFLDIRNVGNPYVPDKGTVQVDVKLRTSTGKEYLWVFPGALDALDANESTALDIHPFIFYDSAINEIQVCISSDDAEANPANNCRTKNLTVTAPVLPWRACIGVLISIADALLDATPAKQVTEGVKLITHIFALQIPGMVVACSEADEECADAVTAFLVDSAIGLGKLVGGATVLKVLDVGHAALQAFKDSLGCGDYLGASLRAWVENSNHRSVKVNAVAVRSPAYVRVVDSSGRRAGFLDDGSIVSEIPDADAFQLDGEKYILYPGDDTAMVELKGTGTGTFDLIVSLSRPGGRIATMEYLGVPVTAATKGKIDATGTDYSLALDDNGDGAADRIVQPDEITEEEIYQIRLPAVMTTQ